MFSYFKNFLILKPFVKGLIKHILILNFAELKKKISLINKKSEKIIINKKKEEKNIDINNEYINLSDDENENLQKRKYDEDVKMNSYVYESFGSDSKSLSIEPNSENNDKLHQLKMMLLIKNNVYNDENYHNFDLDSVSNSLNNSEQQITSKKHKKKKDTKLDISGDDENKNKKIKNDIKTKEAKDLKEKNNEEEKISLDVSADKDKSNNDIEWGYDIIKEEKKLEKNKKDKDEKTNIKKDEFFDDDYKDFEKDINLLNIKEKKEKEKETDSSKDEKKIEEIKTEKKEEVFDKSNNLKIDEGTETEKKEEKQEEVHVDNIKIENTELNKIIEENSLKEKESSIKQIGKSEENIKVDKKVEEEVEKEKEKEKKEINIKEQKQINILKLNLNDNKEKKESEKIDDEATKKKKAIEEEHQRELLSQKLKQIKDIDTLVSSLTEEIISNLISTEVKSPKKKLIPLKKFKYDKFEKSSAQSALNNSFGSAGNSHDHLSKEFGLSGLSNQLSLADDLLSLNDSLMSNYSSNSVFNKTIKDKKKERTTNLYFKEIAPRLIKLIRKEIISKYDLIYENISTPMKNNSEKLMISLVLQDAELLRDNYKNTQNLKSITKILDKDKILKTFEPINKKIRNTDNVTSDNFYDKMLNDCIVETAIEIINRERLYGKNGEPLQWSSRMHELAFKYKKNEPNKLADYVCKKLKFFIKRKVGLISDNYDDMSMEQINMEKDKRLTGIIRRDLDDNEYQWNNLEMEETQLKVDNTEQIMEQLYNEVIEILEHIQYSRTKPELYHNKSIYACDDIPKLDFQLTTNEDGLGEGNDKI